MKNYVVRFLKDESGATAIEYGLIAALIAVGIIAAARGARFADRYDLQHRHRRDEEDRKRSTAGSFRFGFGVVRLPAGDPRL